MSAAADPTDFLLGAAWLDVASSNVARARYDPATETLTIAYQDGRAWDYDPISAEQAEAFARAESAGTWLWDNVRVRGSRSQHRVNARPAAAAE